LAPSGTSLSAPLAASLFSLANQALTRDGYDTIGYANPMLYWMGENCTDAFNDITIGDITANGDGDECLFGFPAAPGWDAATGFGSINFGPFVECAKRYQDEVRNVGLEMLPDGSYRGSPTDVADRRWRAHAADRRWRSHAADRLGQMTAAAVVLAVLPLLAV
jgi:hypothetical protein